jgi:phenylalanine-4-hydroxylase
MVIYKDSVLFQPDWGMYDMAVGENIVSAFAGPADPDAFELKYPAPEEKTHHLLHTDEAIRLHKLYDEIRVSRESKIYANVLQNTWQILKQHYPEEWLLALEITEEIAIRKNNATLHTEIISFLKKRASENEEMGVLIENGLHLITNQ